MSKHIAIIGASGAIGKAMALKLAEQGNIIYAYARSVIDHRHSNIAHHHLDLEDEATIRAAASKLHHPLDQVIIATGVLHGKDFMPEKSLRDLSAEKFQKLYAINTIGPALVAKHFIPKMAKDKPTIFAAISARVGSIEDNRLGGWYSYRASKAALNMVLKNIAIEVARRHKELAVIGLHPGTVDSDLSHPFQGNVPDGKLFSPDQSANYLLDVLNNRSAIDSGKIFDWQGKEIPY